MEVQPNQHDGNSIIEQFTGRNIIEVLRLNIPPQTWIRTSNVRDILTRQLLLNPRLAQHKHFILRRLELQDARDVYRGAVGRAEDFFRRDVGDADFVELLLVVEAGFCAVVGNKDELFTYVGV